MPRQHTHHSRIVYLFPDDFPHRLKRFKEKSVLSWAELHRRLEAAPETIRRWRDKGVQPNTQHFVALLVLADSFGLGRTRGDRPTQTAMAKNCA